MPSHPDRVRRSYEDPPRATASITVRRCTCLVITGGHRVPSVEVCPCHPNVRPPAQPCVITDEGFTANVIEGDHH